MEERKQQEVAYYDREANLEAGLPAGALAEAGSHGGVDPFLLSSYQKLQKIGRGACNDKKVLDYGCGSGAHLGWLAKAAYEVVGIDLSEQSLHKAREKISREGLANATVQRGDCEKLDFPDGSFDVVFDGGTFSSLDLDKALGEIHRVLKPGGALVGIETLGHNPLANLKRKLNVMLGRRTAWAADHIFKVHNLATLKRHFSVVEAYFFHPFSWILFPVVRFPGGVVLMRLAEQGEQLILTALPFLKRYAFKIVFICIKYGKENI